MSSQDNGPPVASVGEVCHRAKNDLQTAATLVSMAAAMVDTPDQLARTVESRLFAMSIPYSLAGKEGRLPSLGALAEGVLNLLTKNGGWGAALRVNTLDGSLSLRAAGPLCLWLFEACSNAIKHGLKKNSRPELVIELCNEEDCFVARVTDNGPGLPEGFLCPDHFGLGLKIARAIAEIDFRGQLSLDSANHKMTICLKCPLGTFQRIIGVEHAAPSSGVDSD